MMELRTKCLAIAGSMILSFAAIPQAQADHSGVTVTFHSGFASAGSRPVFSHRGLHGTRHFRHRGFTGTIRFGRRGNFHRSRFRHDRFHHRDSFDLRRDIAFGRKIRRDRFCAGKCESRRKFTDKGSDSSSHSKDGHKSARKFHRRGFCAGKCQKRNAGSG